MSVRVKVCGLRRPEDVDRCLELGVDMLGFNCWPSSPRYVSPGFLPALLHRVVGRAEAVLVMVQAKPDDVGRMLRQLDVPRDVLTLQLHGDEDPREYRHFGVRLVQVLRVGPEPVAHGVTTRVLVDFRADSFGGTGHRIGTEALQRLRPDLPEEWILAGGLDAGCVAEAIETWRPWGVDVASGVELSPGIKDHAKLEAFVKAARTVQANKTEPGGQAIKKGIQT